MHTGRLSDLQPACSEDRTSGLTLSTSQAPPLSTLYCAPTSRCQFSHWHWPKRGSSRLPICTIPFLDPLSSQPRTVGASAAVSSPHNPYRQFRPLAHEPIPIGRTEGGFPAPSPAPMPPPKAKRDSQPSCPSCNNVRHRNLSCTLNHLGVDHFGCQRLQSREGIPQADRAPAPHMLDVIERLPISNRTTRWNPTALGPND
jgi:hypothetical protein